MAIVITVMIEPIEGLNPEDYRNILLNSIVDVSPSAVAEITQVLPETEGYPGVRRCRTFETQKAVDRIEARRAFREDGVILRDKDGVPIDTEETS